MANNFKTILKYAVKAFREERRTTFNNGKKEIIWTLESDVEAAYEKYKENNSADAKSRLASKIYKAYGLLWENLDKENTDMMDDLSCLSEVVGETVNGKYENNYNLMLKNYVSKGGSFLMYFHSCVSKKYSTARAVEVKADELGSGNFNKSGWAKVKKINTEARTYYGRDAGRCSDEQLEQLCAFLNERGDFKNLTVQKARRIISENTLSRITNRTDEENSSANADIDIAMYNNYDGDVHSEWSRVSEYWSEDDEKTESDSEDYYNESFFREGNDNEVFEKIGSVLEIIRTTENERYYFNLKIMYDFMYEGCSKKLNSIRPVYCDFLRNAVWLNDRERKSTVKIYEYMLDFSIKKRRFPTIGFVAKDVLELNSSSQLSHAYKAVAEKLKKELGSVCM